MSKKLAVLGPRVAAATLSRVRPIALTADGDADRRRVYNSSRWRNIEQPAKLRRDPLCQRCKYLGLVVEATDVDHWIPLAQGGEPYADSNLVSLCHSCHAMKTACERSGEPFPPIEPSAPRSYAIA